MKFKLLEFVLKHWFKQPAGYMIISYVGDPYHFENKFEIHSHMKSDLSKEQFEAAAKQISEEWFSL